MKTLFKYLLYALLFTSIALYLTACAPVSGGSSPQSSTPQQRVVVDAGKIMTFGDSFTSNQNGYVVNFGNLGYSVDDRAVYGSTIDAQILVINSTQVEQNAVSTLMIGLNDSIIYGTNHLDVYSADLEAAIRHLTENDSALFVGTIVKLKAAVGVNEQAIDARNQIISDLVASLSAEGLKVFLVDVGGNYDPYTMTGPDGVHPNQMGNDYIGQKFTAALAAH